jgi:hypothetical protein
MSGRSSWLASRSRPASSSCRLWLLPPCLLSTSGFFTVTAHTTDDCFELASDTDRQAFVGKLVNDIEHPISASIVGAVLDKVVGPDVIAVLRPQPDARSIGQPEPASFGLFIGDLQPLASPDALDPLVVDYPARLAQQPCDLAIAVAAVLLGKLDNIGRQTLLVLTAARDLALRRAMLSERRAGATLGDMQLRSHLLNAGTATRGA